MISKCLKWIKFKEDKAGQEAAVNTASTASTTYILKFAPFCSERAKTLEGCFHKCDMRCCEYVIWWIPFGGCQLLKVDVCGKDRQEQLENYMMYLPKGGVGFGRVPTISST